MPRLLKDYPVTEPGANGVYSVDFAQNVPVNASLVSASWTLGIHATLPDALADLTPQARVVGAAMIAGTVASTRIAGLLAGNDYLVTVTGTMSDGEVVILWTVLPCRMPQ
jgi:hypothetical protein